MCRPGLRWSAFRPARWRRNQRGGRHQNFAAYGVSNPDEIDPRAKTIDALVAEVQSLRARLNDMEDRLSPTKIHDDAGKAGISDEDDLPPAPRES